MAESEVAEERSGFDLRTLLAIVLIGFALMCLIISMLATGPFSIGSHRASCMNNQHEIWTAVQVYENRKQRYPGWRTALAGRQISWAVQLMPFLGMSDVYNNVWANSAATIANSTYTVGSNTLAYPGVKLYVCPSDDQDTPSGPWLSYVVNCGLPDTMANDQRTETQSCGLFFDNVVSDTNPTPIYTTASDVQKKDGTSQTLGMGENLRVLHWTGFAPGTTTVTEYLVGFNWEPYDKPPAEHWLEYPVNQREIDGGEIITSPATNSSAARLNSPHGNVVVVTFADGHAVSLSDKIDLRVYNKLCTPDGMLLGQDALEPAEYLR